MSRLDELFQELCPNGVTYKKLVDAVSIERGKRVVRSQLSTSGKYPVYQNSLTPLGYHTDCNYSANTTFIIVAGAAGEIGFSDRAFWAADDCFAIVCPEGVLNRYVYHLLLNNQNQLLSKVRKASIPRLSRSAIENLVIPVPPLEIQREIVRILDNFTELTEELTAELTARKTQYTYYRDKLLANSYKGEIKQLEECCDSIADGDHQAPPKADSGVPFITISDIDERHEINLNVTKYVPDEYYNRLADKRRPQKGDVLYTVVGSYGIPVYISENKKFVFQRHIAILRPNNAVIDSRYLYHAMNGTAFHRQADLAAKGAAQKTIGLASLAKMTVPVPPLDVQNRIVNVLDNFEKICSDLNIGLPAEIEARQKQYEYYRDKLLTFAENGNTILSRAEQSRAEQSRAEQSRALIKLLQYVFGYVRISLGDIGSICMCKRILKSQTNTVSGVPFYKIGTFGKEADAYISQETFNEYRSKYNFPKKGDVLISAAGTIGRTVLYDGKPAYFQDSNIVWIDNDESIVLNSYLRYCYELKPWKASEGGTIPRLYNDNIAKAVIAVPSIEEQKRIVSILDRFDVICNDLTSGLPAEIEARQKQYEYYRDKLLTFKEVAAT